MQQLSRKIGPTGPIAELMDLIPAPCHLVSATETILWVNDAWLSLLGFSRDDVLGKAIGQFVECGVTDPERQSGLFHSLSECGPVCEALTKSGLRIAVQVKTRSFPSAEMGADQRLSVLTELTDIAQSTESLRWKAFRLESCLEGTKAATWAWNVQTGQTVFNERWAEMIGHTLADLAPTTISTWMAFAHPDDLARSETALTRHWAGETAFYDVEARMRHKDGRWVWVHDRGRVFTWTAEGKPEWMFGTHISIDDQKTREADLRLAAQLLDQAGRLAGIGGWRLDLATGELLWTSETRRIHGVGEDYVPDLETALGFYPDDVRPLLKTAIERSIVQGEPWDLELPLLRQDGKRLWVRAAGQVASEAGAAQYLYGALQDITQRVEKTNALLDARRWLDLASRNGGIGLWLFSEDGQVSWNDQMAALFCVQASFTPRTLDAWAGLLPEAEGGRLVEEFRTALSERRELRLDLGLRRPKGKTQRVKMQGLVQTSDQDRTYLIGSCIDVTEEFGLAQALEAQQSKLETILDSIADAVVVTDQKGCVEWMNPAAEHFLGSPLAKARGMAAHSLFGIIDEKTQTPLPHPIEEALRLRTTVDLGTGHALLTQRPGAFAVTHSVAPLFDRQGDLTGAVFVFRDVSRERAMARETEYRAEHDALTGLLNRESFELAARATIPVPLQEARKTLSALLFIDLDGFKTINDQHGHSSGDHVLREVAKALRGSVRHFDLVGRIGGDEFLVLLKMIGTARDVTETAERIKKAVSEISLADQPVSCSIGAAIIRAGESYEVALHRADQAMYRAKRRAAAGIELD